MQIFRLNIKRILKNKIRLAMLIFVPIMFIGLFLFGAFNTVAVGICDEDNSQLSQQIIKDLKQNKFYHITKIKCDQLIVDTVNYEVDYAIHFEKGFEDKFFSQAQLTMKEYYFVENENVMNAKTYLQSYINHLVIIKNSTESKVAFYEVLNNFDASQLKIGNTNDNTGNREQAIFSIGFMVYFLIYLSVVTCGLIIEDRKNGTLQRIFNSPISLKKYLFESLLSYILIGFLQVFSLFVIFQYIFKIQYGNQMINLFLLVFTFSIVSVTMGLFIVSIVKNPIQAYLTVGVIASPLAMLGGCYWPLDMMPIWLQNVSQFIPTTWVMKGVQELIVEQGTFIEIIDK